jgi:hypothetical protein
MLWCPCASLRCFLGHLQTPYEKGALLAPCVNKNNRKVRCVDKGMTRSKPMSEKRPLPTKINVCYVRYGKVAIRSGRLVESFSDRKSRRPMPIADRQWESKGAVNRAGKALRAGTLTHTTRRFWNRGDSLIGRSSTRSRLCCAPERLSGKQYFKVEQSRLRNV